MKSITSLFLLLNLSLIFYSCEIDKLKNKAKETEQLEIEFNKEGKLSLTNSGKIIKELEIEIASTDYERENGLMHRSKMEENKGMLFLFDKAKIQTFWMKNTRIPLDIIYLSEEKKVINIAKNVQPFVEGGVPPSAKPAKYVLEVNAGSSEKWGIIENETEINYKIIKQP